jgi:ribosome-associated toxin RatA of RatAB toxin-antitoxin module|tara:strand:- start:272 stop:733 length:462 start_codon:yes stop_codon:yes gene_type:complete
MMGIIMGHLQFQTSSPIEPKKLMDYLTDFTSFQKFFPHQIKDIKILERKNNEVITQETIIFSTLIKSTFTQKSHHKLISDKELHTKIIEGPAKGSMIEIICTKNEQGSQITFNVDLKLSLKAKFLEPFIKKLYKRYLTAIIYKINNRQYEKKL